MGGAEITIDVRLFGEAAQRAGVRTCTLAIAEGASAADALGHLVGEFPTMAEVADSCALAVDEALVPREAPLAGGCTLAVLPPVSGG